MMEKSVPKGDSKKAVAFLRWFCGDENRVIQSIHPETKKIRAFTFTKDQDNELLATLERLQGVESVYFQVNPLKGPINGARKATKADVREIRWLQVDKDPVVRRPHDEERKRIFKVLPEFHIKPNLIIDSGGGGQAFWRLKEPIPLVERPDGQEPWAEGEAYSQQLALELTADACHNCDRIMRLPFTTNMPDAKKREKGRVPALASVIYQDDGSYPLTAFGKAPPARPGNVASTIHNTGSAREVTLSDNIKRLTIEQVRRIAAERGNPLPENVCVLIVQGYDPDRPDHFKDRSRAVFYATIQMVKSKLTPDEIAAVITDPSFGISAHVLEQKRPMKYALRQVKRAGAAVEQDFECGKDGAIKSRSRRNIELALAKSGVELSFNIFQGRVVVSGITEKDSPLNDDIINRMWFMMQEEHGFLPPHEFFCRSVTDIAHTQQFHPVLEYVDSLKWDGLPRLDTWLSRYLGAEDTPLNKAVGAIILIAAVRRIRQPGCKFDEMLVLEGAQGAGKSTAINILAVKPEWFSDNSPLGLEGRETLERVSGFWIIEISELSGFRKRDVEELKGALSRQTDRARLPYARLAVEVPRQCIFIGTTNAQAFLEDHTGNRRFWIVKVGSVDLDALLRDRDQLWAEAAHREAQGEDIRLPPSLYEAASAMQERYALGDAFADHIASVIGDIEGWIGSPDVRTIIGKPTGQFNGVDERRMGEAMRRLGFTRKRRRVDGGNPWGYQRGELTARIFVRVDAETGHVHVDHNTRDDHPF